MKRRTILPVLCLIIAASLLFGACGAASGKCDILLFMVGGKLESETGAATRDLQELIRASREEPSKSCAVYLCGSEKWELNGTTEVQSCMIRISGGEYVLLQDRKESVGTTAEDLCDFLEYGKAGCDLIFWGHGGAGTTGIGENSLFDNDTLSLHEIGAALEKTNKHFRVIGFDACSMATLQAAWLVSPYCNFFCASTRAEELSGWNYKSILPILAGKKALTAERLRGAFREEGMTVLSTQDLLSRKGELRSALNRAKSSDTELLSEILTLDGELLLTSWDPGELPTEALLPGLGDVYQAFLTRK